MGTTNQTSQGKTEESKTQATTEKGASRSGSQGQSLKSRHQRVRELLRGMNYDEGHAAVSYRRSDPGVTQGTRTTARTSAPASAETVANSAPANPPAAPQVAPEASTGMDPTSAPATTNTAPVKETPVGQTSAVPTAGVTATTDAVTPLAPALTPEQQTALVERPLNKIGKPALGKSPAAQRSDADLMASIKQRYGTYVDEASSKFGVDAMQLMAIMAVESGGNPTASSGSAYGLMQVTKGTWKSTQQKYEALANYDFDSNWRDPRINILFGAAVLRDKMAAVGVKEDDPNFARIAVTAYNGGEGVVNEALRLAREAGSSNPSADCLKKEYIRPAIEKYPSVYSYYLTGSGRKRNTALQKGWDAAREKAIDLKCDEISKYPEKVDRYLKTASGVETDS